MGVEASKNPGVQTVALVGSYVPRQCGIATFTKDLRDALAGHIGDGAGVVAMDDGVENYAYPPEVAYQINQHRNADYDTAAEILNNRQIDAAIIQHEYGIFGGRDGAHVLSLARQLRMPTIATLHTVLTEPSVTQRATLRELIKVCDRVVVMSHKAKGILVDGWGVPDRKIAYIPHGVPDVPFIDPHYYSERFNTIGRRVLLTFGLLGPGKGIETALAAMPKIIEKHPDVLYIVLGATHPHVLRNEGTRYLDGLRKIVSDLGLENHVRFDNHYVSTADLMRYLGVADVYVIPYPSAAQITSGTLAYALGAGKAVVSTPFWHAEEMCSDGRGLLFPFNDSGALADNVLHLLDNEIERHAVRKRAYKHARPMIWSEVAKSYLGVIEEAIAERRTGHNSVSLMRSEVQSSATVKIDMAQVRRLSDDCGILQHAIGATGDRRHGYCTDDNARALIATLMHADHTGDARLDVLSDRYLSFLHYAFNDRTCRFRNFMDYGRAWLEQNGSEDSHGRAVWALGVAVRRARSDSMRAVAARILSAAADTVLSFTSPRSWAFAIIGLHHYLQYYAGDTRARTVYQSLAGTLMKHFEANAAADWPWLEDVVTYDNAKLPHALLLAGADLGETAMVQQAVGSLEWLVRQQIDDDGRVSLIGNDGWLRRDGTRARFDQQPVEAMALVEACVDAFKITSQNHWLDYARTCLGWFTGSNELGVCLVDRETGGCADGLHTAGMSLNQGAESSLAWVIAALSLASVSDDEVAIDLDEAPDSVRAARAASLRTDSALLG
jgi:glycosyltransferase involved in cell wall biosynthesis